MFLIPDVPPFSLQPDSDLLSEAQIGAHQILNHFVQTKKDELFIKKVIDALDLMFHLHSDQVRPGGAPYVDHTLLTLKVLVKKFGVTDVDAICAMPLHDAPEDQSKKILALFGIESEENPRAGVEKLSSMVGYSTKNVEIYLSLLTNPDFDELVHSLNNSIEGEVRNHALELLHFAREADVNSRFKNQTDSEIAGRKDLKNILYLGHIVEIYHIDNMAFTMKMADFYANGLHLHHMKRAVAQIDTESKEFLKLNSKYQKLRLKYEPVIDWLSEVFSNPKEIIISQKADNVMASKLRYVKKQIS